MGATGVDRPRPFAAAVRRAGSRLNDWTPRAPFCCHGLPMSPVTGPVGPSVWACDACPSRVDVICDRHGLTVLDEEGRCARCVEAAAAATAYRAAALHTPFSPAYWRRMHEMKTHRRALSEVEARIGCA